jgi:hypothetical protein
LLSYRRAWERKNREGEAHRSLADGGGTATANVQKKYRSPGNVAEERGGGGGIVDKDVERRRGADRRRSRFSVPWSRGEAQEAEGQRKKTTVWGKKEKFTPAALFIYLWARVVGVVVLHYPDRFRGESPHGGTEWGGGYCNRATRQ